MSVAHYRVLVHEAEEHSGGEKSFEYSGVPWYSKVMQWYTRFKATLIHLKQGGLESFVAQKRFLGRSGLYVHRWDGLMDG